MVGSNEYGCNIIGFSRTGRICEHAIWLYNPYLRKVPNVVSNRYGFKTRVFLESPLARVINMGTDSLPS